MSRFAYISDLPPQIKDVLSVPRQEQWLTAYHAAESENPDEAAAYETAWSVVLADVFSGEVESDRLPSIGEATPAAVDSTGKTVYITVNADEAALTSGVERLVNSNEMKQRYPKDDERRAASFSIARAGLGFTEQYGFIVDTRGLEFDESNRSWVQMVPFGEWVHPVYGHLNITPERAQRFASNVNNNVRGQQLDIDYAHKEDSTKGQKAAGWVIQAEVRDTGVWGLIEWTPVARKELDDGEWRYFSPEFQDEWLDPRTQTIHRDVLFGGALTNRPFLKGILPINLSEVIAQREGAPEGSIRFVLESLRNPQQHDEGTTEEVEMEEFLKGLASLLGYEIKADDEASQQKALSDIKTLSERKVEDERARKFAEDYPEEAKALAEGQKKFAEAEAANKLSEWKHNAETKTGLPAKLHEGVLAFRTAIANSDLAASFDELMAEIVKTGPVDFSEKGSSRSTSSEGDEPTTFEDAIDAFLASEAGKGKSYAEATSLVAADKPELHSAWRARTSPVRTGGEF
jgi:phage I-like protein